MFRAESWNFPNHEKARLSHTGALTAILAEWFDSSERELPQPGYRLRDYARLDGQGQPHYDAGSTHSRLGDWVVSQVEEFPANLPTGQKFEEIIVCYCRYVPIEPQWQPVPKATVSLDSFGGDEEAYRNWLESEAVVR
jgi:hypothetical protein